MGNKWFSTNAAAIVRSGFLWAASTKKQEKK